MLQVALLGLLAGPPVADHGVTIGGEAFDRQQTMTCTWFTNFENSRFDKCVGADGRDLLGTESASIRCAAGGCTGMETEARRIAHWTRDQPLWGTFAVRLVGRVSISRRPPRYLGDGTRTVLVERFVGLAKGE
jgi:hypothetical protein